jgi:uncharacterized protein with HEPN domain
MSKRNPILLLEDIYEAITKINAYISNHSFETFQSDDKTIDAVVRNLEIIGEAANKLPQSAKEKASEVQWIRITGLRNRIIHEYFGVDLNIIWKIINDDLDNFSKSIKRLRKEFSPEDD